MERVSRSMAILLVLGVVALGCGGGRTPVDPSNGDARVLTGVLTAREGFRSYLVDVTEPGILQAALTWEERPATLVMDLYEVDFLERGVSARFVATSNLQGPASRVDLTADVVKRQYELQIGHARNTPSGNRETGCSCDATFRLTITGPVARITQR